MSPHSKAARPISAVNAKLNQRLSAYVAAASAAGVGALVAVSPAEAKIVYTPANTVVNTTTAIDLNHDGIADFSLALHVVDKSAFLDITPGVTGNAIRIGPGGAAAGFHGVPVGPGEKFGANTSAYGFGVFMADFAGYSTTHLIGPWANTTNRYLGFKFLIQGQVHYGWARMSVTTQGIFLTGYAYETTPNTNIIEGNISGPSFSKLPPAGSLTPAQCPASLGMLARGTDGLALWRRDEEAVS